MREAEWLASRRSDAAAVRIGNRLGGRKIFLIGCGYARSRWDVLPSVVRDVIVATEARADGLNAKTPSEPPDTPPGVAYLCHQLANGSLGFGPTSLLVRLNSLYGVSLSIDTLRCIAGNPFRPTNFAAVWRTTTATTLARQMYESRDFSALPVLADALQDAGCENAEVLAHCRGFGPHVRGCWVVDAVLKGR